MGDKGVTKSAKNTETNKKSAFRFSVALFQAIHPSKNIQFRLFSDEIAQRAAQQPVVGVLRHLNCAHPEHRPAFYELAAPAPRPESAGAPIPPA
jgi:hypothetical protein